MLQAGAILIDVHVVFRTENKLRAIAGFFYVFAVKTVITILAIVEVVAERILEIVALEFLEMMGFFELFASGGKFLILYVGAEVYFGKLFFVIGAAELFIFKTIFFFAHTHAEETVFATYAIAEESAGMAILAILTTGEAIRFVNVDAVVAKLVV